MRRIIKAALAGGAAALAVAGAVRVAAPAHACALGEDATLFAQAASWSYCPEHTNEFGSI
jgi:hypothetical protein